MDTEVDMNRELCLDGNAVAGMMQEIFGEEMTANPSKCATCGNVGMLGSLMAYTQAPGIVLRCPICGEVVLRMVVTPREIYLDARGAVYFRMKRDLER